MDLLTQELRQTARGLLRRPGFLIASVAALAIAIGANVALFSVFYAVLLNPLPFGQPDRLITVFETNPERNWRQAQVAAANFLDWREQSESFVDMAAYNDWQIERMVMVDSQPLVLRGNEVTASPFEVLQVTVALGRSFVEEETWQGGEPVVVLAHGLWQRLFGGDPDIVGAQMILDDRAHRIIGVMPEGFSYPFRGTDFWVPMGWDRSFREQVWFRRAHSMRAVARLRQGVSEAEARAELAAIARRLELEYSETNTEMGNGTAPLDDWVVGSARLPLQVLLAAVGFVLLIACANVTNMLLAQRSSRSHETAVRHALGASRRQLALQAVLESTLLAGLGGTIGFLLGALALRPLLALSPGGLPRIDEIAITSPLFLFTAADSMAAGLLLGILPAWRQDRSLRPREHSLGNRGSANRRERRGTALLVTAQVALSVPLLMGAGLMARTLFELSRVDPGFDETQTWVARLSLPNLRYDDSRKIAEHYRALLDDVSSLPGVESAALSSDCPSAMLAGAAISSRKAGLPSAMA